MAKKLISCLVVLTLVLGMVAAFNVSAADYKLTIIANDATAKAGEDVTVTIGITSSVVSFFAFNVAWDTTKLTYKSYNLLIGLDHDTEDEDKNTTIDVSKAGEGTISFQTLCDEYVEMLKKAAFDNKGVLEITFTATDDLGDDSSVETEISLEKFPPEEEAYIDKKNNLIENDYVAVVDGTVTIKTAPEVTLNVEGSGKVGEELSADVDVDDNADVTYSWTIDGEEVSDEATYTPTKDDLGKTITLTVAASYDNDEDLTTTKTATVDVIKNDSDDYAPAIDNVSVSPSNVKAGNNVVITYDFEDGNGLDDDSYAIAYLIGDDQEEPERIDGEFPTEDGKITIPTNKDMANKKIGVVIVPRNEDGDTGRQVVLDPISIGKKSGGSKSTGGGASLVPKDEKEDEKECIIMTIDDVNIWRWDEWVKNDVPPIIVNKRTFLPSRFVAEALGAKVDWDDATKTVTIVKGNISIILVIGSDIAVINGEEVKFDAPAFIQDDRTYTPTRLVAEALGATVDWDDATRKVTITR